jgi:hypothetical protein
MASCGEHHCTIFLSIKGSDGITIAPHFYNAPIRADPQ